MKEKFPILLAAAFGGISPNLLRLAVNLMNENPELPELTYLLGLAIFALMGAVVAWIWEETDFKKAFYLGIGLPAVIQMGAGEISKGGTTAALDILAPNQYAAVPAEDIADYRITTAAFFQDNEQRQLKLSLEKYWPRCTVVFSSSDSSLSREVIFPPRNMEQSLAVPDFAHEFYIEWRRNQSLKISIPASGDNLHYHILTNKPMWSGLLVAIGLRSSDEVNIELQKQD